MVRHCKRSILACKRSNRVETNPKNALERSENLADFYRTLMTYCTKPIISVREVQSILEQYLFSNHEEYERYHLSLQFELLEDARVPSMVIQPLVENVIKHGIKRKLKGCEINVHMRQDQQSIYVEINDNGSGMRNSSLESIFQPGHALHNIRERLALLYGDDGKITTDNRDGGGHTIRLIFSTQPKPASS